MVQLDARNLTDEEAARIIHQVLEERRRQPKPRRVVSLHVTAGRVTGALCLFAAGYLLAQIARSALHGWLPAMSQHTQAVLGGFVLGMMFMAGVVLAALAVFGVVRS